jgi:hypothetical protein
MNIFTTTEWFEIMTNWESRINYINFTLNNNTYMRIVYLLHSTETYRRLRRCYVTSVMVLDAVCQSRFKQHLAAVFDWRLSLKVKPNVCPKGLICISICSCLWLKMVDQTSECFQTMPVYSLHLREEQDNQFYRVTDKAAAHMLPRILLWKLRCSWNK